MSDTDNTWVTVEVIAATAEYDLVVQRRIYGDDERTEWVRRQHASE